jgi:pimeloyl-ACP methyl ester carboxylesterase
MKLDVSVHGVRSPYLQRGPEHASEAVVFLHGNPGPKEDWAVLMERLGPDIRAVAPDMPGFGAADRPREFPYSVDGYAEHLAGFLEQLGIERAHLVLHDFGGAWGLRWMADHRDRVGSLVLVNTGIMSGYRWHGIARVLQTPVLGELFQLTATRVGMKTFLDRRSPKPMPDFFYDRVLAAADWGHKRAVLALYRASKDASGASERVAAQLAGLQIPVLVVWGAGDPFVASSYAHAQRETFPNAVVHLLEGAGHWPFIDQPDEVAALVVPFLRRALAGTAQVRRA